MTTPQERLDFCEHGISLDAACSECSKIKIPAMQCHYCGKFTRYEDIGWEMPYVGDLAIRLEPPESVPVCHRCSK